MRTIDKNRRTLLYYDSKRWPEHAWSTCGWITEQQRSIIIINHERGESFIIINHANKRGNWMKHIWTPHMLIRIGNSKTNWKHKFQNQKAWGPMMKGCKFIDGIKIDNSMNEKYGTDAHQPQNLKQSKPNDSKRIKTIDKTATRGCDTTPNGGHAVRMTWKRWPYYATHVGFLL